MKHKNKFSGEFLFINAKDKSLSRHAGEWSVIDLNKINDKNIRAHYGKKLKDILFYREKIKRPLFIKIDISSGYGYYLPVNLYNIKTDQMITVLAVADSGADCSVFDHEIAEAIGINWKKGKKLNAHGGGKFSMINSYRVKVLMSISHNKKFYLEEINIINEKHADNLIGLSGFFNHHQVIFDPKFGIKYKFIN